MQFEEALRLLKLGRVVRRKAWPKGRTLRLVRHLDPTVLPTFQMRDGAQVAAWLDAPADIALGDWIDLGAAEDVEGADTTREGPADRSKDPSGQS
jgi:hypothetical protein